MKSLKDRNFAGEPGSGAAIRYSFGSSLRAAASAAFLGLAMLGAPTSALAGVPGLNVIVTSLAPLDPPTGDPVTGTRPISYSVGGVGGVTYQTAYSVTMTASTPVGSVYFYALSKVANGLSAPFDAVSGLRSGDSCPVTGGTQLQCTIGPIAAGGTTSFTLLVRSPTPPDDGLPSALSVSWDVQTGQGQPNPSNLVHDGSQDVTLRVGSAADGVQSYVLPGQALGVADNIGSTGVKTPEQSEGVTVGVKQQIAVNGSCASHYIQCLDSTVRIVGTNLEPITFEAAPLLIDLVRAAASLKKNARIENATLFYTAISSAGGEGETQQIHECINGPAWQIPSGQSRCVVPAVRKATTLTFKDGAGNWHFRIIARSNGKIAW